MPPIFQKLFRKMSTQRLHNPDIKKLVQVLRSDPHCSANPGDARFEKATQVAIKKLPGRLRSLPISYRGSLCRIHKGFDGHLIEDVWSWIQYELKFAVGRFLYPVVMADVLSVEDEYRVRQLEPVVRLLKPQWSLAESAAPGKKPIDAGEKWITQENGCAACMLTRIGSDEDVLFALFACMYGRLRSRGKGQKGDNKVRSRRLRFVRSWLKTHPNGHQAAEKAYDLGVELKAIRRDVKASLRRPKGYTVRTRNSLDELAVTPRPNPDSQPEVALIDSDFCTLNDRAANTGQNIETGHTSPPNSAAPTVGTNWKPSDLIISPADLQGAKFKIQSPTPRYADPNPHMPFARTTKNRRDSGHSTTSATRPRIISSIYSDRPPSVDNLLTPRPAAYTCPSPNDSRYTVASSILSYNDPTKPPKPRGYDSLETVEEWVDRCTKPSQTGSYIPVAPVDFVESKSDDADDAQSNAYFAKYRPAVGVRPVDPKAQRRQGVLLDSDMAMYKGHVLPKPNRCSIYSAFGEKDRIGDESGRVDNTPPHSPSTDRPRKH